MRLLRLCSAVPARDQTVLWRALVFNWLIGNCDAHAKNFSLLYDARDPTLAPLYDLLSTTVYPELTRRMAMNIGRAHQIDEVTVDSWEALAAELGLSRRFVSATTGPTIERVVEQADRLAVQPSHDNSTVKAIVKGIHTRA